MGTQIILFDRLGNPIEEIDCNVRRSWELNGIGKAVFTMAKSDPKCIEPNLRIGNCVLIENDDVGRWGGVIDLPRRWTKDSVIFMAYTIEHLAKYSFWQVEPLTDATAGDRFEDEILPYWEGTGSFKRYLLELGTVYKGGTEWTTTESDIPLYTDVYSKMKKYAEISGQEWEIRPRLRNTGKLYFEASWYSQVGSTYSNIVLEEDRHLTLSGGSVLVEQGEIVNEAWTTWTTGGSQDSTSWIDTASQVFYGPRIKVYSIQYADGDIIYDQAELIVESHKEPQRAFTIQAVNDGDIFKYLQVGNTVGIRLVNYGFTAGEIGTSANVRILAREYEENDGFMTLTVEEVT